MDLRSSGPDSDRVPEATTHMVGGRPCRNNQL